MKEEHEQLIHHNNRGKARVFGCRRRKEVRGDKIEMTTWKIIY